MNVAFGRYRLLDRLGQGGMAEVFRAKSYGVEGFEKILVIKRILPELAQSPDFVEMFIHEAKLAVRLSHANIVQVFDLGKAPAGDGQAQESDAYYIAMEYVHGLDLASVLAWSRRNGIRLPLEMGAYVAAEVAKGLDHAHRRRDERMRSLGIVHLDVSPQNVLLSFEGEAKITDFGIAKARGALDGGNNGAHASKLQGKFGYMSPEQARGEDVDARSDLFSLGTVLYECVAGVNPFAAPTHLETVRRVRDCEYPSVELLRPDVPRELAVVLQTAMAPAPAHRYADAGRMYEALLAFLYAQKSRYGAHDLAVFLSRFREPIDGEGMIDAPSLDADARNPAADLTPVEVPYARQAPSMKVSPAARSDTVDRSVEVSERREVTALVIELPREATTEIVAAAAHVIERWGGKILRREAGYIGALFGLGDPDGRDTETSTRCALVALRSVGSAGLHTGRVDVSRAGEPRQDEKLDVLFDTARDLARVREGRAAMSAQAMRQVKVLFEFEQPSDRDRSSSRVAAVLVKNVREPGEAFGRFVGRRTELRCIGEVLAMATRRSARVLTVRGDNGVGKTRLLHEVERRLRKGGYDVGFYIAACPPRGAEFPLSGIVSMLQVLCGTAEGDANDRILDVQPRLRALGLQADEVNAVLTVLGASVRMAAGNARALLTQAFARMVQSLCEDRPHAFAWDGAHAIDEESLGLLGDVLPRVRETRVVFAFAARAGFTHPLERAVGHTALDLGDLDPPDVERLVALRLAVDEAPAELLRFVRTRAGGHPLFVEEVIKALIDAGAVTVTERRVVSMKLVGQDLALPKTLRGLVASRIARLAHEDRATLQAAAILGDPIDLTVLANMLGKGMTWLEHSIARLKERDFVVDRGASELCFASPLVPEIVVDGLTPEAGREMHSAAGQALEVTCGSRAAEHAARIARHFYVAGDRERAANFFVKSGERCLETGQLETAARDYARAIALADPSVREPEELACWLEGLASAVRLVRSAPDAQELSRRVIGRVDQGGAQPVRVRARVAAGRILAAVQQMGESRQRLAEAASIADADEQLMRPVLIADAELATRQGDFKRAFELLEKLRRILRAMSDDQERHRVALHFAHACAALGDRPTALASLAEAEGFLPDDGMAAVERTKVRALVDYFTRDFHSAAVHCEKAIDMGRELGLTYEVMLNLHNFGDILLYLGDLPRAYGALRQSLALCEECGYERLANFNRMFLAYLDGLQGTADAERLLRQGIAYADSKYFTWDVVSGGLLLAKLLDRCGRLDVAREEYEKTRALALSAGHRFVADDCEQALRGLTRGPRSPDLANSSSEESLRLDGLEL